MSLISQITNKKFIYKDQRLSLPGWDICALRILESVFIGLLIILCIVSLFSGVRKLNFVGYFILLFLADSFLSFNNPKRRISYDDLEKPIIRVDCYVSPKLQNLILNCFDQALNSQGNFYLLLMKSLLPNKYIQSAITRFGIKIENLKKTVDESFKQSLTKVPQSRKIVLEEINNLMRLSFIEALFLKENYVSERALFLSLFDIQSTEIIQIQNKFGINKEDLYNTLILSSVPPPNSDQLTIGVGDFLRLRMKYGYKFKINRSWTARPTDYLDTIGIDLTDLASKMQLGLMIGHEKEFEMMLNVLARPGMNNVLLVGDPGSGKETMVAYLAFKIVRDEVPPSIFDKRLVSLNIGNVTSGAKNIGELQERFNLIAKEVLEAGNIILHIPNISALKQTTVEGAGINAADLLKPVFQSGLVPVIGTATSQEYREIVEKDKELASMFEVIRLEEVSESEAIQILSYEALGLEKTYKVTITYNAIKRSVYLAKRYLRDSLLPKSALDLMREAVSYAKSVGKKIVTEEMIIDLVEAKTRIPLSVVTKSEASNLLNLENLIHQRLIDQEEAVKAVAMALREYRAGLAKKTGPIASFLFVGPTGVGKTELAKSLAAIYFGSESKMIRFDMSEYQDPKTISRFIGSPDGLVSGVLTEAVKANPFSLILLDEFEKASQNVLNLFLQVFDEGRLTDNTGTLVEFNNTIIIATSNALSQFIKEQLDQGISYEILCDNIKKRLTSVFTPELLNRFSKILVFKPLSQENVLEITKLQISGIKKQLIEEKQIDLEVSNEVIQELAYQGFDPTFGARPLEGVIREKIKAPLSEKILKGEIKNGSKVKVDFQSGEFIFGIA